MSLPLKLLGGMGVRLVSCQPCIKRCGFEEKVAASGTRGMDDIVRLTREAGKVIAI